MDGTAVFIDVGYLIRKTNEMGIRLDFVKLSNEISSGTWVKTIVYDALPMLSDPGYAKMQRFHGALKKHSKLDVKLGRLQYAKNGRKQKGVDVKIALDLVEMGRDKDFSHAVLITGDSDLQYAVELVKKCGITTSLAYFKGTKIYKTFLNEFDSHIQLTDEILKKCRL